MAEPIPAFTVQVCFPAPTGACLRELRVTPGTTLREAIEQSGVLREFAQIDLTQCQVGVFGKIKTLETEVRERDRIEIYRPLIADPKESRRRRAEKKAAVTRSKSGIQE